MATKRKRTKSRRRRRMGAAGLNLASPVVKLAAVAGAYFLAATPVNNAVNSLVAKVMPLKAADGTNAPAGGVSPMGANVALAGEAIGGYMLLFKGRSSLVKTAAGALLAGAALKSLLVKTGMVTGYQSVPVIGGYQSVPVIGNYASRPAALNGYGVNGYRVNGRPQSVMGSAMDRGSTSGSDLLG